MTVSPCSRRRKRVGQRRQIEDPVLQQVADPLGHVLQQPERVRGVEVLRQQQHGRARSRRPQLRSGAQALVGERRRHPDVEDHDVRIVGLDQLLERLGRAGLRRDLDAEVAQDAHDALPDEHHVVDDDDLHGKLATYATPPSTGSTSSRAADRADAILVVGVIGRADAVMADGDRVPPGALLDADRHGRCPVGLCLRQRRQRHAVHDSFDGEIGPGLRCGFDVEHERDR